MERMSDGLSREHTQIGKARVSLCCAVYFGFGKTHLILKKSDIPSPPYTPPLNPNSLLK